MSFNHDQKAFPEAEQQLINNWVSNAEIPDLEDWIMLGIVISSMIFGYIDYQLPGDNHFGMLIYIFCLFVYLNSI